MAEISPTEGNTSLKDEVHPQLESQSKRPSIREWVSVIAHTHSKSGSLAFGGEGEEFRQNWQDGQFPTRILAEAATSLGRERTGGFTFVDTDHAAHAQDNYHPNLPQGENKVHLSEEEVRELRRQSFLPENLPRTIAEISQRTDVRRQMIEKLRRDNPELNYMYTGVEADLINIDGTLDVNQEVRAKLDCVGASLHAGEWKDANDQQEPTLEDLRKAYMVIIKDPTVDVINHMIRELSEAQWKRLEAEPGFFDDFFVEATKYNKGIEINLRDLVDPKKTEQNKITFKLVERAKERGVKFTLGTDFHRVEQYMSSDLPPQEGQKKTQEVLPEAKEKLKNLVPAEKRFSTEEEALQFEDEFRTTMEEIFSTDAHVTPEGDETTSMPKNLLSIARPVYRAITQLQECGLTPKDILNGNKERFSLWINQRRGEKDRFMAERRVLDRLHQLAG